MLLCIYYLCSTWSYICGRGIKWLRIKHNFFILLWKKKEIHHARGRGLFYYKNHCTQVYLMWQPHCCARLKSEKSAIYWSCTVCLFSKSVILAIWGTKCETTGTHTLLISNLFSKQFEFDHSCHSVSYSILYIYFQLLSVTSSVNVPIGCDICD